MNVLAWENQPARRSENTVLPLTFSHLQGKKLKRGVTSLKI